MKISRHWLALWRRLALVVASAVALGWLLGAMEWALLLAISGCLGWQLWQLYRLDCWMQRDQDTHPPPSGLVWTGITERVVRLRQQSRKRKRKLSRLWERFQQATAALPDAAVILGDDDRIVWCNGAARSLLGLSAVRDLGLPISHLLRHPGFIAFLARRSYGDGGTGMEFPSPIDDGLLLNARMVPYGKKQRLLLVTDISHVRRLEQMRREFVANVSHELRTPLTVIVGYLETLLDTEDAAMDAWRQPVRRMWQQAGRMLHLIEDLLMLARLESHKERTAGKPVAVPAVLAEIADDARALSGEQGHHIDLIADTTVWMIGNEKELRSAFSNLVINAVRYTPCGGQITIRWFADSRGLHLVVEDNGEGVAPHHIPRLTERFYRVNRDRSRGSGGTGLGLSIVKHVLNNHGGELRISSELGVGSVFSCHFPSDLQVAPPLLEGCCNASVPRC